MCPRVSIDFSITLFLLLLPVVPVVPVVPFLFFVLFFVRLRFLLGLLLLDVRLDLMLASVEKDSSACDEIVSFSVTAAVSVTSSVVCITFCKYKHIHILF